ncbi:hypothetical protein BJ878DRAFT_485426 [Calycina marina]|uniref:Uncharacterized protein n=1 Tax=Calycina marina TaxID=1763456 RepID=A0A9P7ZCB6_9HELO|nr:hypothetical protein BJ878DRAFT_485426 [Calycina marina]
MAKSVIPEHSRIHYLFIATRNFVFRFLVLKVFLAQSNVYFLANILALEVALVFGYASAPTKYGAAQHRNWTWFSFNKVKA